MQVIRNQRCECTVGSRHKILSICRDSKTQTESGFLVKRAAEKLPPGQGCMVTELSSGRWVGQAPLEVSTPPPPATTETARDSSHKVSPAPSTETTPCSQHRKNTIETPLSWSLFRMMNSELRSNKLVTNLENYTITKTIKEMEKSEIKLQTHSFIGKF